MNRQTADVWMTLAQSPSTNQRELAGCAGMSLGAVNKALLELRRQGIVTETGQLSAAGREALADNRPRRAILLAAGPGMRMVPINQQAPKPLLEVRGETLIERLIRQLREAGVTEIAVVVGFLKEQFEYLIDSCGVKLIVNPLYASKNNLHSLALASAWLEDAYIVPCDLWFRDNPFRRHELYSWYLMSGEADPDSRVRVNRRMELSPCRGKEPGQRMIGLAYLRRDDAARLRRRLLALDGDAKYDGAFWEAVLEGEALPARVAPEASVVEINTYEQLRELDGNSAQLRSEALEAAAKALGTSTTSFKEICVLKKGMTNRSFLFSCGGERYIMRIPGEGTDRLIDRQKEALVYRAIRGKGLCDDPVYLDPRTGFKISRFLEGVHNCDSENEQELRRCMRKLRDFHRMELTVPHRFDLFAMIDFYESLWNGAPSAYRDYARTKAEIFALKDYLDSLEIRESLTHIDAVPDNFLFYPGPDGEELLQLIDWEYAGMQDPHVDIAMFCIYALYEREQVDRLIDLYFEPEGGCGEELRTKIYCYVAVCGLLWSNWCEFKRCEGVEFGEYSLRQYRYAKDYARLARSRMPGEER